MNRKTLFTVLALIALLGGLVLAHQSSQQPYEEHQEDSHHMMDMHQMHHGNMPCGELDEMDKDNDNMCDACGMNIEHCKSMHR